MMLKETADLFAEVYAPGLAPTVLPVVSNTLHVLNDLRTMLELRVPLRCLRRSSASGQNKIPDRTLLSFPEFALLKLLW